MVDDEIVLDAECTKLTRLPRNTRDRLAKRGQFPRSFKIGSPARNGRVAWSRTEITAWLAARMAARLSRGWEDRRVVENPNAPAVTIGRAVA
jgi:predicted DNA-binding transcriptional regulator AlpA